MNSNIINILLADDDADDCLFFKDALDELCVSASLSIVNNGAELMNFLKNNLSELPHILFLDVNMPRKNGAECLHEIKQDTSLKKIPIIIYSTSAHPATVDTFYQNGAQHFICKPADFDTLKCVIKKALEFGQQNKAMKPAKEFFLIKC